MTDASPRAVALREVSAGVLVGAYAAAVTLAPSQTLRIAATAPPVILALGWWAIQQPARWIALFLAAALLLPPLPLPLGDSGPHPALAVAALGLLIGMLRISEWRPRLDFEQLCLAAYFCVILASIALAVVYSGLAVAAASLARVLLFGIALYIFFYVSRGPGSTTLDGDFRWTRLLFFAGVASALFACLDFYFQWPAPAGFGQQFVWLDTGVYRRAQGFFYEASTLGNLCTFFLIMTAVCLMRPRAETPVSRRALLAGAAVLITALMLSYSRGSLVNLVVASAVLLYWHRKQIRPRRLLGAALALSAAVAASYFALPRFGEEYWSRLAATARYLLAGNEGVLSGRLETWRYLTTFLLDHPWHAILGVGYKTLPYSDFTGKPIIADNAYLNALVETGLLGLAAMLLFNLAILRMAWRAARHSDSRASFFGLWMLCFWVGEMVQMLSGDLLTYWRVLPVYLWVLALAVRHSSAQRAE